MKENKLVELSMDFSVDIINLYACQMMHRLRRYDAFASQI